MNSIAKAGFDKMDALSTDGIPFFFLIDFLLDNVKVYTEDELQETGLIVDFPSFTNLETRHDVAKDLNFKAIPISPEHYHQGFETITQHLHAGNSYLVNYTCKSEIKTNYTLHELFWASDAKYKVLYPDKFVFFSPETFVEIKNDVISTHPMKGTIDASIENAPEILKNDHKEKAEHYTVVDLLRNDLSMVANNVKVNDFQRIDYIKTHQKNLYAMSSEISGRLKEEYSGKMGRILRTILPAGSILGAPKKKTLEIIQQAETYERGFYTGVCGWFDGKNLDSCVMIRFIEQEKEKLYFKSGGGITHLSKFTDEYQEMKNKIYVPLH